MNGKLNAQYPSDPPKVSDDCIFHEILLGRPRHQVLGFPIRRSRDRDKSCKQIHFSISLNSFPTHIFQGQYFQKVSSKIALIDMIWVGDTYCIS